MINLAISLTLVFIGVLSLLKDRVLGKFLFFGGVLLSAISYLSNMSPYLFSFGFFIPLTTGLVLCYYFYSKHSSIKRGTSTAGYNSPAELKSWYCLLPLSVYLGIVVTGVLSFSSLSPKIATHFTSIGMPDRWMAKEVVLAIFLLFSTVLLSASYFFPKVVLERIYLKRAHKMFLAIISFSLLLVFCSFFDIVWYNLYAFHLFSLDAMMVFLTVMAGILLIAVNNKNF